MTAPHTQCQPANPEVRQHAPLPWRLAGKGTIRGAGNNSWVCSMNWRDRAGNSALLLEAVNSHATLQARVEELTKAMEWQPIKTAPKDRTRILLFQVGRGAFEGWWHTAWPHPEEYWMDDADSEPNPTHWRRTLAPPLEQSGSGK